jgi:catechol 2,3-dioxygenase-like lactoylglutathione lyase family enzyme
VPPALTHFALQVRDLDASIAFYRDYCELSVVHDRTRNEDRVVWLAERGREKELILVLMRGGARLPQAANDYSHFGFAVADRGRVDAIAKRAETDGCLVWPAREEPYPVGYYCGVTDPDGNVIEFSFGQPLGPGSTNQERSTTRGQR